MKHTHNISRVLQNALLIVLAGIIGVGISAWAFVSVPQVSGQPYRASPTDPSRMSGAEIRIEQIRSDGEEFKRKQNDHESRINQLEQAAATFRGAIGAIGAMGGLALVLQIVTMALGSRKIKGDSLGG